ncbi:hypothetical protein BTVI_62546 [Pitangus sulphuratus]|nr:hypothetical protein BTVI_62546 [Pitangus sulphuratus]
MTGLIYEDRVLAFVYLAYSKSFDFHKIPIEKFLKYGLNEQIVEGGDPLLNNGEAVPGLLCRVLGSQYKKGMDILEGIQQKATKILKRIDLLCGKGKKEEPVNYNPVSLSFVPCKIMELTLLEIMLKHMENKEVKCKVLHLGYGNPKYGCRLGNEWIDSNPEENDLRLLGDEKFSITQQSVLTVQKAKHILSFIKSNAISMLREMILPLYSALMRPHPKYCMQVWVPQINKGINLLEGFQMRATKIIRDLQQLSYVDPLREFGLFSLKMRRL